MSANFCPFSHAVFLSQVVWLELFDELACATYVPAAPDARGNGSKCEPLLCRCGVGHGWRLAGGGWPRPGRVLATQLAKFQQARGINNYRHEMLQMRFDNDCLHPILDCLHCPACKGTQAISSILYAWKLLIPIPHSKAMLKLVALVLLSTR